MLCDIKKLVENKWNYNRMETSSLNRLEENIKRTGKYPSLIVRKVKDKFRIVDGHQRFLVLRRMGYKEVNCEVWNINDKEEKVLLATLNELHGKAVTTNKQVLYQELEKRFTSEQMIRILPVSPVRLNILRNKSVVIKPAVAVLYQLKFILDREKYNFCMQVIKDFVKINKVSGDAVIYEICKQFKDKVLFPEELQKIK